MKPLLNVFTILLLLFWGISLYGQGTPSEGFSIAKIVKRADYPGTVPDSSGVGADDILAGYDLDKDGKGEFIFITDNLAATQEGPALMVFEATGDNTYEPVWWYQVRDHTNDNASFPTMTVGDLDGDGQLEILAGIPYANRPEPANPARFLVFEVDTTVDNGLPLEPTASWNFEANFATDTRPSAMDAWDVDGDGQQEVIVGFRNWNTQGTNALMIFSLLGDFQGVFTAFSQEFFDDQSLVETSGNFYNVHTHDVNHDGIPEISAVEWEGSGIIAAFYQSTAPDQYQLVHKVNSFVSDAGALGSFLPWDIDRDGIEEFMMAGSDGRVYVVPVPNGDVSQISPTGFHVIQTYLEQIRGAAIGDFDEDGLVDYLIAGSFNKKIFRVEYKGTGSITDPSSYDFTTVYDDPNAGRYYYIAFPQDRKSRRDGQTLVDMDGDGKRELVFTEQQDPVGDATPYVTILEADVAVSVEIPDITSLPKDFELHQNYPNPFNPETVIRYDIPRAGHVRIAVYNTLGELVRTLVDQYQGLGAHEVRWDGRDDRGNPVVSGVYVYTIESGNFKKSRTMTLLK